MRVGIDIIHTCTRRDSRSDTSILSQPWIGSASVRWKALSLRVADGVSHNPYCVYSSAAAATARTNCIFCRQHQVSDAVEKRMNAQLREADSASDGYLRKGSLSREQEDEVKPRNFQEFYTQRWVLLVQVMHRRGITRLHVGNREATCGEGAIKLNYARYSGMPVGSLLEVACARPVERRGHAEENTKFEHQGNA